MTIIIITILACAVYFTVGAVLALIALETWPAPLWIGLVMFYFWPVVHLWMMLYAILCFYRIKLEERWRERA